MKSLLFIANMTASKVIFVSEYLKKALNFGNTKSSVIYNTSEVAVVHRAKLDHDAAEKFVVLMICSMKVYKGVMEFISLARLMERDESIAFELVLNASDREVSAFFGDTNIPLNMNVFSKTLDTSIFYERANIVLNLTRSDMCIETFGLTILEGMFFGKPAIVPTLGGPVELISDGVNGYHIDSTDLPAIQKAIKFLSSNKDAYERMCSQAKIASDGFSFFSFQESVINALEAS